MNFEERFKEAGIKWGSFHQTARMMEDLELAYKYGILLAEMQLRFEKRGAKGGPF